MPLAVFDLDGTCIDGQSGLLFSYYLLRRRMMDPRSAVALSWWGIRYKLHLPLRQERARELVLSSLNRRHSAEVAQTMEVFHREELIGRYRPEAFEEIGLRREQGCVTLLVSATFSEIARCAAQHLKVDGVIATKMERDAEGRYTGRVDGPVIAGRQKVAGIAAWADAQIGPGCWYVHAAYGDHHSDASLLGIATEPQAVCPSRSLAAHARREGWPVVTWGDQGRRR